VREEPVFVMMRDGVRLAVTLFHPDERSEPTAALLEALPYRKDDLTASSRDEYERLCDEHGYVVARVDVRGTGSSDGVATDEYPPEEQADLLEVIAWLAAQPWCTGAVGMFGTSYSGFNSLQLAAERPPALRAVCALYSSDDRYTDDVHYTGGALRGLDLLDYVLYMVAMNALPPVPALFGDGWRDAWRARVEHTEPWLLSWLRDQRDGPAWRQGSIRGRYDEIECAVMLVAGWADGYRNNTFRTFSHLRAPKRLLIGPWAHQSPATAHPGPPVDIVVEMARWFDHHLRGIDTGVDREPPVQVFVRYPTVPEPDLAVHDGAWRADGSWPVPGATERRLQPDEPGVVEYTVEGDVGTTAWISCAGNQPWGQPSDQRADDARSLVFDWPVTDGAFDVLGHPRLAMRVRASAPIAHCSVKLCDVFPDGTSALVARGYLNLAHRASSTGPTPLVPGDWYDVDIELDATSWRFETGHRVRLALAGTDWPNIWAPPGPVTLAVDRDGIALTLPVVPPSVNTPPDLARPSPPTAHAQDEHDDDPVVWRVEHDVLDGVTRCVIAHGTTYRGAHGVHVRESYAGDIDVARHDPGRGHANARSRFELAWPDGTRVASEARLRMRSDATDYHVEVELDVDDGDVPFARRRWSEVIGRQCQ
jgi:putative CocE/NonD family hydrolase